MQFFGYYLTALAVVAFLYFVLKQPTFRASLRTGMQGHRIGIGIIIICGLFSHIHSPHTYFVEFDESGLTATSLLMHESREAAMPTKAHYINGQLHYYSPYVGKRPVLFPFLISVLHDLTGYRPENSFIINALAGFLVLGGIYALLSQWYGKRYGVLGVLLWMTLPLFTQNVTGAGFDLFNIGMLVLILNLATAFVRKPDALNLNLFVFGLILLAQARYESILFLIAGALVILAVWRHQKKIWMTFPVALAPLLLISPMLSIRVFTSFEEHKQLQDGVEHFFHVQNLPDNFEEAVYYFFQPDSLTTNSLLLSVFGFISLAFCLVLGISKLRRYALLPNNLTVFFPFLGVVLLNTFWALTNFWGQFTDPVVSRITLPLYLMLTVCCVITAKEFFGMRPVPRWIHAGLALWFFAFSLPAISNSYHKYDHLISRTNQMAIQFAKDHTTPNDLFIGPSTLPFIINQRPAVPGIVAEVKAGHVIRSREIGFYNNIYLVMELKRTSEFELIPRKNQRLYEILELELVHEERFRTNIFSRIYRVQGLKPGVEAWDQLEKLRNLPPPEAGAPDSALTRYYLKQLP